VQRLRTGVCTEHGGLGLRKHKLRDGSFQEDQGISLIESGLEAFIETGLVFHMGKTEAKKQTDKKAEKEAKEKLEQEVAAAKEIAETAGESGGLGGGGATTGRGLSGNDGEDLAADADAATRLLDKSQTRTDFRVGDEVVVEHRVTVGGKKVEKFKGVVTDILSKHCWVAFEKDVGAPYVKNGRGKYLKERMVFAGLQVAATSNSMSPPAATTTSEPAPQAAEMVEASDSAVDGNNGGGNGGADGSADPSAASTTTAPTAAPTTAAPTTTEGIWQDALDVFKC
jgi:hypothetical protein